MFSRRLRRGPRLVIMHIGLADVPTPLRDAVRQALAGRHTVIELDPSDPESVAGRHCEVVVHGSARADLTTAVDRATRGAWHLIDAIAPRRYVQLSSMRVFDGYPSGWDVSEWWAPRPTTSQDSLVAYLGELTARELCRARPVEGIALRLDRVVDAEAFDRGPVQPDWLHLDDAARAVVAAIEDEQPPQAPRWRVVHVVRGDESSRFSSVPPPYGFQAEHTATANATPADDAAGDSAPAYPHRPAPLESLPAPQRITVFGAGGPLAAATVEYLADGHELLLTDARPLAEVAAAPPQSLGAPLPSPPSPPHREQVVDITDAQAVREAARGADCLINCAVVRHVVDPAFAVNVLGTLHVMTAAAELGIPRVVATGPALVLAHHPIGYAEDREVDDDTPPRPGDDVYFLTKFLSAEITRIYAETYAIACPMLLFCGFVSPGVPRDRPVHPFSVTWPDSGRAMAAAATVSRLPEPMPTMHIFAPSPHGRYRSGKAQRVLGWQPQDSLEHYWYRTDAHG